MPRNLVERCEVLFPVTQPELKKRLRDEILAAYLADNTKARILQPDGEYIRAPRVGASFSAQEFLIRVAEGSSEKVPREATNLPLAASNQQEKGRARLTRPVISTDGATA